ncbi:hypothetical protein [Amycolatopsis sp. lyj-84]|uniref:hypothetical protein n=1 Tax=Amycolatopsis sp. lyj-84 TaxID=2789284 RepID=UPI00397B9593
MTGQVPALEDGVRQLTRSPSAKHTYLLKGLVRCDICAWKMQGAVIRKGIYYRCIARTMAPGSPVLADHPKTVNLREDVVIPPLNAWLCQVFDPDRRDETVAAMVGAQPGGSGTGREIVEKRLRPQRRDCGGIRPRLRPAWIRRRSWMR